MDIRGIEITNQLRSAIRAKLLELGVRYDEELPDYILVMVVNKKSREQMNDDLHLFLEDSTSTFVDWLHDQVLKKLQRVTVSKKKSRDLVPTAVVKLEEDKKKRKDTADQAEKLLDRPLKSEEKEQSPDAKSPQTEIEKSTEHDEAATNKNIGSPIKESTSENVLPDYEEESHDVKESNKDSEKSNSDSPRGTKRTSEISNKDSEDDNKESRNSKRSKTSDEPDKSDKHRERQVKSSITKPRITSVVSVKNRLGELPTKSMYSIPDSRQSLDSRNSSNKSRFDEQKTDSRANDRRRSDIVQNRLQDKNDTRKKRESEKDDDMRSRLIKSRQQRFGKISPMKSVMDKPSSTLKSRLGPNNARPEEQSPKKPPATVNEIKRFRKISNVKSRLGSLKSARSQVIKNMRSREDKLLFEDEDDDQSVINTPVKSRIVAVHPPVNQMEQDDEEEDISEGKISSKVIVTPRPLKPLQPKEKRASQSILLRAVAEANQSVVRQKNPEPPLKVKELAQKPIKPVKPAKSKLPDKWKGNKNLSVHLRAKKRYVMENIQVELKNSNMYSPPKSDSPEKVSDDPMGVVMSLFQRSNDNQKFLVTLSGYNNNIVKDRSSDDEERLEMDVNEDEELELSQNHYKEKISRNNQREESPCNVSPLHIVEEETIAETSEKTEDNENQNLENVNFKDVYKESPAPTKRRKLSPIVYNRSRSSSPGSIKTPTVASTVVSLLMNKKPQISSTVSTAFVTTAENCRYWPNCTLGSKCAYYHPELICSSFPACKFGDKCAYKHPKCKFGISCTKIGCMFSHPTLQCKYHPFCMNLDCPYSHPITKTTIPLEPLSRAQFKWKKQE